MRVKDCCYLHSSKLSRFRTCCAHSTTQFHSLYSINYILYGINKILLLLLWYCRLGLCSKSKTFIKFIRLAPSFGLYDPLFWTFLSFIRGFHSTISHRFQILPNKKNYHGFLPKLYRHIYNGNDGNDLNQRGENFS